VSKVWSEHAVLCCCRIFAGEFPNNHGSWQPFQVNPICYDLTFAFALLIMQRFRSSLHSFKRCSAAASRSLATLAAAGNNELNILQLHRHSHPISIYNQLQIEEALFRADNRNWLITNRLAPRDSSIVMGISGKPEDWLNVPNCINDGVTVVRRFSGGGTVYLDENSLMITFILNRGSFPDLQLYPRPLIQFTEQIYSLVFNENNAANHDNSSRESSSDSVQFALRGNDYCFGHRKFAGNAQSISRDRWLHHTSFLWDYNIAAINKYLSQPLFKKQPEYRQQRNHHDFLTNIKDNWPGRSSSIDAAPNSLSSGPNQVCDELLRVFNQNFGFKLIEQEVEKVEEILARPHDRALNFVDLSASAASSAVNSSQQQ
jgi:lipoate-protein ligase A